MGATGSHTYTEEPFRMGFHHGYVLYLDIIIPASAVSQYFTLPFLVSFILYNPRYILTRPSLKVVLSFF